MKIPYMCVIGDREVESGTIAPRQRDGKDLGPMKVDALISLIQDKCSRYE
jgi:threonyl-tRNA synthetase